MSSQSQADLPEELTEDMVADYLAADPEFFHRHPELVAELRIPHSCGDAVSLLEHQTRVMRERYRNLQGKLEELLQVARDNDRLAERMHRLMLELFDVDSYDAALDCVKDNLRGDFQVDVITLKLFDVAPDHPHYESADAPGLIPFAEHLREQRPQCGRFAADSLRYLFGDSGKAVASTAVIPLSDDRPLGLLALGSFHADRFHPGQGTVFLRQLGAVVARALRRHRPAS